MIDEMSRAGARRGALRAVLRRLAPLAAAVPLLGACQTNEVRSRLSEDPAVQARIAREAGARPIGGTTVLALDGRAETLLPSALRSDFEPVTSPALQREIQRIATRLLAGWTVTPLPQLGVVISPLLDYGAFATPERRVFVNLGVLRAARSEDEIAAILGHEISHILLGHSAERQAGSDRAAAAARLATSAAMVGTSTALSATTGHGSATHAPAEKRVAIAAVLAGGVLLQGITKEFTDPGWARQQETEADRLGYDLSLKANYSPTGSTEMLRAVRDSEANRAATEANLRGSVSTGIAVLGTGLTELAPSAMRGWLQLGGIFGGELIERGANAAAGAAGLAERHDSGKQRIDALDGYIKQYWKDEGTEDGTPNPFFRDAPGRETALMRETRQWVAAQEAAGQVLAALAEKDPGRAQSILGGAQLPRYFPATYHVLRAKIFLAEGKLPPARQAYEQAVRLPTAPASAFADYAFMLAETGQVDPALRVLDQGAQRFGGPDLFLPARIQLLTQAGREDAAKRAVADCAARKDAELLRACELNLKPVTKVKAA